MLGSYLNKNYFKKTCSKGYSLSWVTKEVLKPMYGQMV